MMEMVGSLPIGKTHFRFRHHQTVNITRLKRSEQFHNTVPHYIFIFNINSEHNIFHSQAELLVFIGSTFLSGFI